MTRYRLYNRGEGMSPGVMNQENGSSFIDTQNNEEYLKWLDKGNTPEPADPIPEPVKSKKEIGIEKLKAATTIAQIKAALLEALE